MTHFSLWNSDKHCVCDTNLSTFVVLLKSPKSSKRLCFELNFWQRSSYNWNFLCHPLSANKFIVQHRTPRKAALHRFIQKENGHQKCGVENIVHWSVLAAALEFYCCRPSIFFLLNYRAQQMPHYLRLNVSCISFSSCNVCKHFCIALLSGT